MNTEQDYILLKWGTLKGYCLENSPEAFEACKKYHELGASFSAMMQKDTEKQKELLFEMIDKVNGYVQNDWTGEIYDNKEDAKNYIRNYNNKP